MVTLFMRFPGRRYHATPWGHHVNEGLVEWPPSPWRLLRALLAVGYTSGVWGDRGPNGEARSLIEKLAEVLPSYSLPSAVGAHSRHYMPVGKFKNGREDTTLVFDTWAQVDEAELAITWDVGLTQGETDMLACLVARLGYLGRSESWVVARMAMRGEPIPESNCFEAGSCLTPGPGWGQVPLMAPERLSAYHVWREEALSRICDQADPHAPNVKTGKRRPGDKNASDAYPQDLIACLHVDTNWLRSFGWSQPPGSRRVFYWRKSDGLEAGVPSPRWSAPAVAPVEAMLLSLSMQGGNDHALPSVTRTLPQAERLHRQMGSALKRRGIGHSISISGCDAAGIPLRGAHQHNHILPLDLDCDDHLDHVLLWAPMGLDANAQAAIRAVRQTYTKGGAGPVRIALMGFGALSTLSRLPGISGERLRAVLAVDAGAKVWRSLTPFVPPRFLKKAGRNVLEDQVRAELASRDLPVPEQVRIIEPRESEEARRHRHYVRMRRFGPAAPADCGFTLELRFATGIRGPLCIGYGSHFGLGLFAAVPAM